MLICTRVSTNDQYCFTGVTPLHIKEGVFCDWLVRIHFLFVLNVLNCTTVRGGFKVRRIPV